MNFRIKDNNFPYIALTHFWNVRETVKCKFHHRTGHDGPEGEYKYTSTLSLACALDGVYVVSETPRPLYP
jgi:hypothetical protein